MNPRRAAEILQTQIPLWRERRKRGQIAFFGGTFTGLPMDEMRGYLEAARPYLLSGDVQGIRISTRPDSIDEEKLLLLKEYGVTHIELGVQSLDDEVLRASGRAYTASCVEQSAALIRHHGFTLGMQMMPGLPKDTAEKSLATARQIIKMGAAECRIYPTLVLRSTPLQALYAQGKYQPLSLDAAVELTARLKELFISAGVNVLNVGLHSGMVEDDIVSGPYHPAFGQLVSSRICRDRLSAFVEAHSLYDTTLAVIPGEYDVSVILGQHRSNVTFFQDKYKIFLEISKKVLTNEYYSVIL